MGYHHKLPEKMNSAERRKTSIRWILSFHKANKKHCSSFYSHINHNLTLNYDNFIDCPRNH